MYSESQVIALIGGLSARRLKIWVDQELVRATIAPEGLLFGDIDVARLHLICALKDDMEVDEDLLPTILSLLDQVYDLRRDMRALMQAIETQPEAIQTSILSALAKDQPGRRD